MNLQRDPLEQASDYISTFHAVDQLRKKATVSKVCFRWLIIVVCILVSFAIY